MDLVGFRQAALNDLYDDVIVALWIEPDGMKHAEYFQATCDPGFEPEINPHGIPLLLDGSYDFELGVSSRSLDSSQIVLRQKSMITVARRHSDGRYEGIDTGNFGILIKPGGASEKIGAYGYGSQAIAGGKDGIAWKRVTEILKTASSAGQKTFRYFLFTPVLIDMPITNSIRKHGHGRNNR